MEDQMKNDGGRAFPVPENMGAYGASQINEQGMSLRDWFAGQALAHTPRDGQPSERAAWAYALADAMLAERTKQ
jgi:hypothetical protein